MKDCQEIAEQTQIVAPILSADVQRSEARRALLRVMGMPNNDRRQGQLRGNWCEAFYG